MRRMFTKEDIYEMTRGVTGPWQERWYHYMGSSVVLSFGGDYVTSIVLVDREFSQTLPIFLKKGDRFLKLDEETFWKVRGSGEFVGKVRLPTSIEVVPTEGSGIVGTIHWRRESIINTGYTKWKEVREWRSTKTKFKIKFSMESVSVYGEAWERFFEVMEKRREEKRRSKLIEVGRKWCMERGLKVKHEEVYLLVGESVLEEKMADELREDMELRRLLGVLERTEEYSDFDSIFYVGPDRASFRFKKGRFVYGMLDLLFTNDPMVLLEHIS